MESPPLPSPDFRRLFESAPGLYLVLTPDLVIVAVSEAYLRATMTRRQDILGRGLFEVFPDNPDDPAATGVRNLRASLDRVLEHAVPDAMAVQKYDIRRPEGGFEERFWSPVNSPVFGPAGGIAYIIHRVEDVTEFVRVKRSESEKAKLSEELRARAEKMEVEVFLRAQQLQTANEELRTARELLEQRVRERTADLTRANEDLQREMIERNRAEEALRRRDEQLRQAQKMEAVGRLAGGIAHDFNNMMSVVLGYTILIKSRLRDEDPIKGELEQVRLAAERAAGLTRQLLAFSRQQVLQPRPINLNQVISAISPMLKRLTGEQIEISDVLRPEVGLVHADPGQMEQVLMNLVVNARDAMPKGGKLTIETANVDLDEEFARQNVGAMPGPHVLMAVSDTGVGMSREVKARVFEPFFTTKERGKGTGLGLSTVHGIVEQSGGRVWVYSEEGRGTTFKVYLPRIAERADGRAAAAPTEAPVGGSETILLVEDEDLVRAAVRQVLERNGYRVVFASDGAGALDLCTRHAGPIDLVLTDVIMPGMTGREMAERLEVQRPGVRVCFMSGYTDDAIVQHGVLESTTHFLQKPFTPDALLRKVREVLAAK